MSLINSNIWSSSTTAPEGYRATGRKRAVYSDQVGSTLDISGAKTSPINREVRIDNLTPGQYEVQITRLTAISTDIREMTKAQWTGIGAIVYDDLYYPNLALLGIRAKATGQLNGSVNVLTTVIRKQIEVFDESGTSQGLKNLDNPAWVFWDALTNKDYGYGLSYGQVDFATISEWADWCDELVDNGLSGNEKRAVFNGTFDFEGNLWDALCKIATVGRGAPIIKGTKYSVIVDKSAPMVQLFNMGNIIQDSLKISYIGDEDLATEVEVQFTNKDNQYANDTLSVVVPEWFTSTNQAKKTTIQQMGITNESQAYRAGRYYLNNNKNIRRTAEFKVAIDAIDCEAGDVIGLSHDVPMWGQSGRIVSATGNTVTLDKEVVLNSGSSYSFTVRHGDNTFETLDVSSSNGDTLTLNTTFTTVPSEYDIYSLVESPHTIKLFRINSITRENDDIRKVVATEYNESIVSDDTTILPTQSASEFELYPIISNTQISEHLEKRKDGTIVPYIDISWDTASSSFGSSRYAIYLSKDGGLTYQKVIEDISESNYSLMAMDLQENKLFYFKVIGKTVGVDYELLSNVTATTYTYLGKSAPPEDVTNFTAEIVGGNIILSWDNVGDVDLAGYQIIQITPENPSGVVYNHGLRGTTLTLKPLSTSYTFSIKAIDTSGILSDIAATTDITITNPNTPIFTYVIDKENIILSWEATRGTLPIAGYELLVDGVVYNQGLSGSSYTIKPTKDNYIFKIRAFDTSGNYSAYAEQTVWITPPTVTRFYAEVIDNNVLLRWDATEGTLPIANYNIYKGSDFATSSFIGSKNGTFTAIFERAGGTFTYWIEAIDSAGNTSTQKSLSASVSQPPDYVLNVDWYSIFDGSKTNTLLDNETLLLLPNVTETWQQHFDNNSFTSPQDQINAGSPYYLQPMEATGQYQEVFDYGSILSATQVSVLPTIIQVDGTVNYTIDIEISTDNSTWTMYSNTDNIYATNFRYVRVSLNFTTSNGFAYLTNLEVRLDSKLIGDAGTVTANAGDTNGTVVTFNKSFIDITSITVTPSGTSPVTAVYDFTDVPNPTQFSVYLFNNSGTRVSGDVSWAVKGY